MSTHHPVEIPRNQKPDPPPNRRRDKKQLSCAFCRQRKLKCDRERPCAACTARGLTCHYPSPAGGPARPPPKAQVTSKPGLSSLEDRVRSLEQLVVSTLNAMRHENIDTGPVSPLSGGPSPRPPLSETGTMHQSTKGMVYIGSPHWAAIMDGISELKGHFKHFDERQSVGGEGKEKADPLPQRPLLLYSNVRPPSKEQLIYDLPERNVVDRMVFQYFSEMSLLPYARLLTTATWAVNILHAPTFLRQYESFWASTSDASIHWIGLLYSIMCVSAVFSLKSENQTSCTVFSTSSFSVHPKYLQHTVHCLRAGDYLRGGPHVLETLLHYSLTDLMVALRLPEPDGASWMVSGLTTQLALRMGYHRDPCHFPEISCFEGEMRRRLWAMIHIWDTSFSVISGAPRIIAEGSWDTKPPRNLHDGELDPDCTNLPDSRPDTEITPMSFPLARYKLSLSMGWLIDANIFHGFRSPTEMRRAESRLAETWDSIPARFKFISLTQCLSETPAGIGQRLGITCLYNKMHIMLHICNLLGSPRPPPAGSHFEDCDVEYEVYSRRTCIHAALHNVECLILLDTEARPGGALASLKNKLSNLAVHEFLVATAVLGTFLYRFGISPTDNHATAGIDMFGIESVLRQSRDAWVRWSAWSSDAKRAVDMLDLLFQKLDGTAGTAAPTGFSMALDGLGLNFGWDADSLGLYCEGTDDMLVS